jgi:uncharacterized protein involved in exopolysaccharide biosynthesis
MDIEYNYRGLLTLLFRHQKSFWLTFLIVAAAGIFLIAGTKPMYEAHGSFLVKFGQNARPIAGPDGQAAAATPDAHAEIVQSNAAILQSQDLLRTVINDIGAERLYPDMSSQSPYSPVELASKKLLAGDLDVRTATGSDIVEIRVLNIDPDIAARFVNDLMDRFAARQAELFNTPQTGFLDQQTTDSQQKLEQSQKEFEAFKTGGNISAIDAEMDQLRKEKGDLTTVAYQTSSQAVTQAQSAMTEAQTKEAVAAATYRSDSPVVTRAHESVAIAQRQLDSLRASMNAQGNPNLSRKAGAIDARIAWLETQRSRYNELEQQVKMDEDNYKYYRQRGEEAHANALLDQQNITRIAVIDKAVAETKPVRPRKSLIAALSLIGAILLGFGAIFILELMDDRFTAPAQVSAALGVPVMAAFGKTGRR